MFSITCGNFKHELGWVWDWNKASSKVSGFATTISVAALTTVAQSKLIEIRMESSAAPYKLQMGNSVQTICLVINWQLSKVKEVCL